MLTRPLNFAYISFCENFQAATTTYLAGVPQVGSTFSPYFSPGPIMPLTVAPDPSASLSMVQQTVVAQQKMPRTDRLEVRTSILNYHFTILIDDDYIYFLHT